MQEKLDMKIDQVYHWTDSTSVLKCILNESKRSYTFESNRLASIHSESPRDWIYVNRAENPADDGFKGMKLEALMGNNRWISGSLGLERSSWPAVIKVSELKDDDPEVRKEIEIYVGDENPLIQYRSSWRKLKKSVAWLLRYKQWLSGKLCKGSNS